MSCKGSKTSSRSLLFPGALIVALLCGVFLPEKAAQLADYRHFLLMMVMFAIGLEQKLPELLKEFCRVGPIGLSLLLNYGFFVLLSWGMAQLFFAPSPLVNGFVVLGAVPVTLTSAVIYTRLDNGNTQLAVTITFLSQILGVLITPFLILQFSDGLLVGAHGADQQIVSLFGDMFSKLVRYFLLPLLAGIAVGRFLKRKNHFLLTLIQQAIVVLFVFMGAGHVPAETSWMLLVKVLGAVWLLQMIMVVLVRWIISFLKASDQTALYYTTTQKTLSVGLYLMLTYFPSEAILPMISYHLLQLVLGQLYWRPR